jgi:ABC-type taurine transport system ATPase subunit
VSELVLDHVWSEPLKDVSLRASGGLTLLLGDVSDGTGALVELCAGVRAPRRGRVTLDAERPSASPRCRRRTASLLPAEPGAGAGDVRRWLAELARLREVSPQAVLDATQVAGDRAMSSLSAAERRELACWVALEQRDASLVVLHDPLSACGGGQRQRALGRISELARAAIVLVTTPSLADARSLGVGCQRLDRGLLASAAEGERGLWQGVAGASLTLEADAPRELVAALAREPDVHELRYDERSGRVVLRANELERLASAVARAIVSASVDIRSLRAGADDLDALRAAASAMDDAAGAAYRAARARARPAASATPVLGSSLQPAERAVPGTGAAGAGATATGAAGAGATATGATATREPSSSTPEGSA